MARSSRFPWWRLDGAMSIAVPVAVTVGAVVVDVVLSACAGINRPPASRPVAPPRTVTISDRGLSTSDLIIPPGAILGFVNRDTEVHTIQSDPHPAHTDCPELNLGALAPGQRVSVVTSLTADRSCGYHDENRPDDPWFRGILTTR